MGPDRISIQRCLRDGRGACSHCVQPESPPTHAPIDAACVICSRPSSTDGSWLVRTRSHPTQNYFESGFPHGADQFISAAATNWATQALLLSLPDAKAPARNVAMRPAESTLKGHDLPCAPVTYLPLLATHGHSVIVAGTFWRYPRMKTKLLAAMALVMTIPAWSADPRPPRSRSHRPARRPRSPTIRSSRNFAPT